MNTANILNITSDNNSGQLAQSSAVVVDSAQKQAVSNMSGQESMDSKESAEFQKALKESLSSGQNSDSSLKSTKGNSHDQALPEDGKGLPLEIKTGTFVDATVKDSSNNELVNSGSIIATESNLETNVKVEDLGIDKYQGNTQSVETNNAQVTGNLSNKNEILSVTSTLSSIEQKTQVEEQGLQSVLLTEPVNGGTENVPVDAIQSSLDNIDSGDSSTSAQNILSSDMELLENVSDDPFAQLNFIEQAKNTNTAVGVDSSAIKDTFQNINAETSGFKKLSGLVETQSSADNFSQTKNSELKVDSLFSGSLTDQNSKQQGFTQNNNSQPNLNWMAANSNVQVTVENQTKLIDLDTMVIEEKVDTSKVIKGTSESTRATLSTETITRISEFTVKTPVLNKGWSEEVNNHISYVAKNGGGIAKIKLNPAHLGPVEASIKIAGDGVTVQVAANHATTRDALDLGAARLKEMLQEQGFTQVDVNVSDQGLSKGNRESTTKVASATNHSTEGDLDGVDEENHESTSTKSTINGVVDYYA